MGYIEELRKVVGNRPLNLVGTAVGVINEKGEILLQQRKNGIWGVPGGFLELGESTEDAGRREVLEETGLQIGKMDLVGVFSGKDHFVKLPNGDEFYPITIAYITREILGGQLEVNREEGLDARFFSLYSLPENMNPLIPNLLHTYLQTRKV
ncbi:NUDIX domain-containing protein [Bacillus timonensis]|uniref:NUDIX domain-containing protein n=1 Tax=Bacillus timonensis TaxID=1033734 RepID=A0A4S3PKC8_9BACI|nr:NUDIX hydrolase [Bacillus timonensis]THE09849.1 NUDIX domain-containing protein [Bacillus timonensis]